jgi:acyl transferase domain-containing protein/SAM-dependent methyltransferase
MFQFSAKTPVSLAGYLDTFKKWLLNSQAQNLPRIHESLSKKTAFPYRKAIIAHSVADLSKSLSIQAPRVQKTRPGCSVFVFIGQGAQWAQMGCALFRFPVYAESIRRSDKMLHQLGCEWSLESELSANEQKSVIHNSTIAQPATTALQIALADLLAAWGVTASAVLGHSSGEIAAAYVAEKLTHFEALKVAYHRGALAALAKTKLSHSGAMLAVGLNSSQLQQHIDKLELSHDVKVACINSPTSTTASGSESGILQLSSALRAEDTFVRRLKVNTAYHSQHMEAVAEDYRASISTLCPGSGTNAITFFSSVTTHRIDGALDSEYWVQNLVSPVRFSDTVATVAQELGQLGHLDFLEIGPHPALRGPLREILKAELSEQDSSWSCLPTLHRYQPNSKILLESCACLFERGVDVRLSPLSHDLGEIPNSPRLSLPNYHWDRKYHWHEPRLSRDYRMRSAPPHDLLGLRTLTSPDQEPSWRALVGRRSLPWLADHVIEGFAIFPATAYLSMATEAMNQLNQVANDSNGGFEFRRVAFKRSLRITDEGDQIELVLNLRAVQSGHEFRIYSVSENGWHNHCQGEITYSSIDWATTDADDMARLESLDELRARCNESVCQDDIYTALSRQGNEYGPAFSSIRSIQIGKDNAFGIISVPDLSHFEAPGSASKYTFHPIVFDALLQVPVFLFARSHGASSIMPVSLDQASIDSSIHIEPGQEIFVSCRLYDTTPGASAFDLAAFRRNERGDINQFARCYNGQLRATGTTNRISNERLQTSTFTMEWGIDPSTISSEELESHSRNALLDVQEQEGKLRRILNAANYFIRKALQDVNQLNLGPSEGHLSEAYHSLAKVVDSTQESNDQNQDVFEHLSDLGVEGELLSRMGPSLGSVLSGKTEPLSLLLEDDLLYRAYQDDSTQRCNTYLIEYVRHLVFQNPCMRILELGAGTGGSTIPLFQALSPYGETFAACYQFTDISPGFFEQARPALRKWHDHITMKPLNIEQDPVAQGFDGLSYDLIIATNVLHATSSISNTLNNVHRLLKPGGSLVFTELVENNAFYKMTFGLLPGWWLGSEDGRHDGPLLSPNRWSHELRRASFREPNLIAVDFPGAARRAAFFVARARSPSIPNGYHTYSATLLNFLKSKPVNSELVQRLIEELQEVGYEVTSDSSLEPEACPATAYVVLDSHENPLLARCTTEQFTSITRLVKDGSTIFWITVSENGSATSDYSGGGLITGFARSARSECEGIHFVTLDVQDELVPSLDRIVRIAVDIVTAPTSEATRINVTEQEFKIRGGRLCVPRLTVNTRNTIQGVSRDEESLCELHTQLYRHGTYIIAGGLGKLGDQICRHLVSIGAGCIVLLSRKPFDIDQELDPQRQLNTHNAQVRIITCDISNSEHVERLAANIRRDLPPIKGIIQATMILDDQGLDQMSLEQFQTTVAPKYHGTRNLINAFTHSELDFFITLSSLSGIVGLPGQANYAAGNTYQDAIAHHKPPSKWRSFISLDLPLIAESHQFATESQLGLANRGIRTIHVDTLLSYLNGAMGLLYLPESNVCLHKSGSPQQAQQFVIGLDVHAASEEIQVFYSRNPLFSHTFASLHHKSTQDEAEVSTNSGSAIERLLSMRVEGEYSPDLIADALREKIASLVALSYDDIELTTPIVSFGIDSLIAIGLKKWITKVLEAPMQTSDILDSKGILALTNLILERSGRSTPSGNAPEFDCQQQIKQPSRKALTPVTRETPCKLSAVPKLPLQPLDTVLDSFYASVTAFGTEIELLSLRKAMHDLKAPAGIGEKLHSRLVKLANDPNIDCWLSDIYNQSFWLRRRAPLRPSMNFFSSHTLDGPQRSQAEKAAVLTLAAFQFKQQFQRGEVPQDFVNEEPQCMNSFGWLFNAYRRPCVKGDEPLRSSDDDYIAVMRKGHVYKVPLTDENGTLSHSHLVSVFQSIRNAAPRDTCWVSLLTTAERSHWARVRALATDISPVNEELFSMLEKSLFAVCLDEGSPQTSEERVQRFLFDDNGNRWNDKTLSFVVCENGASALWCEHSMIDGTTLDQLNQTLSQAIITGSPRKSASASGAIDGARFTAYPFVSSLEIDAHIELVRQQYQDSIKDTDFATIDIPNFGEDCLRQQKLSPKGVLQAIISLAVRRHFGHSPASYEAVSMRSYLLGRLEIYQVHTPEMDSFVSSALTETVSSTTSNDLRLLQNAVNTHAAGIANTARGRGWDRQLTALRCVLRDGEEEPAIFNNSLYLQTRPRKVFVSFSNGGQPEWGSVWRDNEALWIGVEIAQRSCRLCVSNGEGRAKAFGALLMDAVGTVKDIIEGM